MNLGNIDDLAGEYSAEYAILNERLEYLLIGEQLLVRRHNPSLGYDLELLEQAGTNQYEHSLYLERLFRTPWHYRALNRRVDQAGRFLEQRRRFEQAEWMAEMRFGFIAHRLMEKEIELMSLLDTRLQRMFEIVELESAVRERSRIERQMLEVIRYQLRGQISDRENERERHLTEWAVRMGLDDTALLLHGEFHELDRLSSILLHIPQGERSYPGSRTAADAIQLAVSETQAERTTRWSEIGIRAGYKRLTPDWQGFLVGISIPLPLLDNNRLSIQRAELGERIAELEYRNVVRQEEANEAILIDLLEQHYQLAADFPEGLLDPEAYLGTLVELYRDGTITMNELVTSVQMIADAWQERFRRIETFYELLTRLEALRGSYLIIE